MNSSDHLIPGSQPDSFNVTFTSDYFNKGDILFVNSTCTCEVTSIPRRGWFAKLLEFITFKLYKARWYYTVKLVKNDK